MTTKTRNASVPVDYDPSQFPAFAVTVDGVHATVPPLATTSLNQKYFFS